jgi:dUTP pyrophosphatase
MRSSFVVTTQGALFLLQRDRIAQLVIQRVERAHFQVVDELPESSRGVDGHGSTGGHESLLPGHSVPRRNGKDEGE